MSRIVSDRELNRATLARQMLLRRQAVDAVTAVGRLCALQAQAPASPYLALWTRLQDFDPAELDAAFDRGTVVKTTLMRSTLHAVTAADHPDFWSAHEEHLRRTRPGTPQVAALGATEEQLTEAVRLALAHAADTPRSNAELTAHLLDAVGPVDDPGWWWAVRGFTRVVRVPDESVWRFGPRLIFQAAQTPAPVGTPEQSLRALVRSYLAAFGPATIADISRFTRLLISKVRPAVQAIEDLVQLSGSKGQRLYDVPDGPLPDGDVQVPPRFLPMWDSVLLAYDDRTRVMADDVRAHVVRQNGDFLPTILVDGHVAGLWLPGAGGIEVSTFTELDDGTWDALAVEATSLLAFLASREPGVYGRYRHWWRHLPPLPTRTLPG